MATYNSIAELLESTDNLTVIRNNSRNDDSTDTVSGVDWFKFKNVVANTIYVNGNAWINFGVNAEGGLKVNRRDQACWYLWREEGNILNENNKFLRIRWRGYSQYNTTAVANLLEFDIVLCNTGDILLKIDTWPTAAINGVNQLEAAATVVYAPSQESKEFSFVHMDENGNNFTLLNTLVDPFTLGYFVRFNPAGGTGAVKLQYIWRDEATELNANTYTKDQFDFVGWDDSDDADTVVYTDGEEVTNIAAAGETIDLYAVWHKAWAWLLQDHDGKTYTVDLDENDEQSRRQLTGVTTLTAQLFYEQGFQFTPDSSVLIDLDRPKLCKWASSEQPVVVADLKGVPTTTPLPQPVVFATVVLKAGIRSIAITGDSSTKWNVSFDDGITWWKHTGSAWAQVTTDGDGCVKTVLESLNSLAWAEKATGGMVKFKCWLVPRSWMTRIQVNY